MSDESISTEEVVPSHLKGLIPDAIENDNVSPAAEKVVEDIAKQAPDIKEWAAQKIAEGESLPTAKVAMNGIFRHPPEFTEEEWEIIIKGLKAHLPLGRIASAVHCERHFLSRKIAEIKEVAQVAIDAKECFVDEAEWQLKKIADAGSLSAVMFILQHMGTGRGWGDVEQTRNIDAEETHISLGLISPEKLAEGQRLVAEAQKKTTPTLATQMAALEEGIIPPAATPAELAAAEDIVKAAEAQSSAPVPAKVDGVSAPPYGGGMPQQPMPPQQGQASFGGQSYEYLEAAFDDNGGFTEGGASFGEGW